MTIKTHKPEELSVSYGGTHMWVPNDKERRDECDEEGCTAATDWDNHDEVYDAHPQEKLYLVCQEMDCGEAFDTIETAATHECMFNADLAPAFEIQPESEAM